MSLKLALAAAAVALSAGLAHAATYATGNMTVQAVVNPTCSLGGVGTYDFGTLGGTTSAISGSAASFTVNCSSGLAYNVKISTAAGNVSGTRLMTEPGINQTMQYSLEVQDPNTFQFSTWTDAVFPSRVGNSTAQSIIFRGIIPVQTPSGAGWQLNSQFVDTVTITIED